MKEERLCPLCLDGLCLNCYQDQEEDRKLMEIECMHDYYEGRLL